MNSKVKELWLSALRSGKYKQGRRKLRKAGLTIREDDTYCCLGVLCELAVKEGIIPGPIQDPMGYYLYRSYGYEQIGNSTTLPDKVMDWAGILDNIGEVRLPRLFRVGKLSYCALTAMNDGGFDFNTIADTIEKQL